jgi:hypothetical protein
MARNRAAVPRPGRVTRAAHPFAGKVNYVY